ncbi:MAG: virulence RhuM family protein [Bacteroidales bacterium]|nr:virulence RhuM family protein [Bacteroidales bacterium]
MALYYPEDNSVIVYQSDDDSLRLDVQLSEETVWLTQMQMVELFQSSKANVSEHIKNIYQQQELSKEATVRKFRTVQKEGLRSISRMLEYYNLDVIISVGYRINTKRGIMFRKWATEVLKEHLLQGYSINRNIVQINEQLQEHTEKIQHLEERVDFFVRTSLPPLQGIFFDGQIFDAYTFVCDLVRSAKKRIVLFDNYVDDTVLTMLDKRSNGVAVRILTKTISQQLQLDINRHNAQYPPLAAETFANAHDRFLCIDDVVYHIGASLKDLGKKWFAFSKMEIATDEILRRLNN